MKRPTKPLPPQVTITDPQNRPTSDFHRWLSQLWEWLEEVEKRLPTTLLSQDITPTIRGSDTSGVGTTYNIQKGNVQRINNRVDVQIDVALNSKGTMAGNVLVYGVPWPAAASAMFAVAYSNVTATAGSQLVGYIAAGNSEILIMEQRSGAAFLAITTTMLANNSRLILTGNYNAAPL